MKRMLGIAAAVAAAAILVCGAAPASADPPPPGCQRDPVFGLNPQVREVCDQAIQADGSWTRWRQFSYPSVIQGTCGGEYYQYGCPPWLQRDVAPAYLSPVETYVVTPDTIPPGEPGHIDS